MKICISAQLIGLTTYGNGSPFITAANSGQVFCSKRKQKLARPTWPFNIACITFLTAPGRRWYTCKRNLGYYLLAGRGYGFY
jgi:hypothetical protein